MSGLIQELLKYLGSFTILAAALAYLFKTLFKQLLDRDLDKYKHELTLERERQAGERTRELEAFKGQLVQSLETYKAQLQLANKEQEIRFTKLHEQRAAFLAELYEQLEELGEQANQVANSIMQEGFNIQHEELQQVISTGANLKRFVRKNKLNFSRELAGQVEDFINKLSAPSDRKLFEALMSDPRSYGQSIRHGVMGWRSEFRPVQEEALRTIEREFRVMLGSEVAPTPAGNKHDQATP